MHFKDSRSSTHSVVVLVPDWDACFCRSCVKCVFGRKSIYLSDDLCHVGVPRSDVGHFFDSPVPKSFGDCCRGELPNTEGGISISTPSRQPYNALLSVHQLVENSDMTICIDNEALCVIFPVMHVRHFKSG